MKGPIYYGKIEDWSLCQWTASAMRQLLPRLYGPIEAPPSPVVCFPNGEINWRATYEGGL